MDKLQRVKLLFGKGLVLVTRGLARHVNGYYEACKGLVMVTRGLVKAWLQ